MKQQMIEIKKNLCAAIIKLNVLRNALQLKTHASPLFLSLNHSPYSLTLTLSLNLSLSISFFLNLSLSFPLCQSVFVSSFSSSSTEYLISASYLHISVVLLELLLDQHQAVKHTR